MIRVVVTVDLDETWGADDCYDDRGASGVIELLHEDLTAFLAGARWHVTRVVPRPTVPTEDPADGR